MTSGLREVAVVGLRAIRRDLDREVALQRPHGAERDADVPQRVRPAAEQPLDHLGEGVGGEVEVVAEPAEQGVAHAAPHQGEVMTGVLEASTELVGDRCDPQQLTHRAPLGLGQGVRGQSGRQSPGARITVIRRGHGVSLGRRRPASSARRPRGPGATARP